MGDCSTSTSPGFVPTRAWWKEAIVYQIYPISFFDSNGDGFGDLNGIYAKLDYLKALGVDVLWLSPIYKSPLADMGYDISDYRSIDPRYGTLEDWDRLLGGVHDRGMKLVMDLVVNHTSDEHDWFIQSRSNKDKQANPKRDWYIWRPAKFDANGVRQAPNNWKAQFQGSVWEYDATTEEYYLHLYVPKQPDLNWENPDVRDAVFETMRFWIDRGCDGFRMDVINMISKTDGLPDAPIVDPSWEHQPATVHYVNGPKVHQYIKEMHDRVLSKYEIMTVGETPCTHDQEEVGDYVLPANKELQMVFQFGLMDIDTDTGDTGEAESPILHAPWKLKDFKGIVQKWQIFKREQGYWNTVFIENHDHSRSVSRFGNDSPEWRIYSAKLLAMLQVTLSGTLYVYQGQEIGMKNFPETWGIEEYKDVATLNFWNQVLERRKKNSTNGDVDMSDILKSCQRKARDHARTPIQWSSSPNAGFTTGTPWMRVNDDYTDNWNVASQLDHPDSVFNFWKQAISVRKANEILTYGDFHLIYPDHQQIFAYVRSLECTKTKVVVLLNFSTEPASLTQNIPELEGARLLLGNYTAEDATEAGDPYVLRGYEGRVYIQEK